MTRKNSHNPDDRELPTGQSEPQDRPEERDPRHVHGAPGARAQAHEDAAAAPEADRLAQVQAERDDLLGRLQRVSADYLNYQKRIQRDIDQAQDYANAELLRSLLPVLDDLERAIQHAQANHPVDDPLLVGVELVHRKALEALRRFGLEPIETEGAHFDPELHQALMHQPAPDVPPMTVLAEAEKGYMLRQRVLRPSKVIVAAPPRPPETAEPEEEV